MTKEFNGTLNMNEFVLLNVHLSTILLSLVILCDAELKTIKNIVRMERIIRYGNIINDPLYNCSARSVELTEKAFTQPAHIYGIICITLGIINEFFFILCVKVMLEPANIVYPAYKIMVVISVCDMCGTIFNSIVYGVIFYYGTTFCDAPNILYITGSIASSAWITGSLLSSVLIINRIVELKSMQNKRLANLFNGKYTPVLIVLVITFGFYYLMHEPSLLLDPKTGLAYWDPQIYENATSEYFGHLLIFNNTIVVSCNSILSIFLCFNISKNLRENFGNIIDRRRQVTLFFQCLAIVSLCNIAALLYLVNFFFDCHLLVKQATGVLYILSTCFPPYIYILLNRSVRQGIIKMFSKYVPNQFISNNTKTMTTVTSRRLRSTASIMGISTIIPTHHIRPQG